MSTLGNPRSNRAGRMPRLWELHGDGRTVTPRGGRPARGAAVMGADRRDRDAAPRGHVRGHLPGAGPDRVPAGHHHPVLGHRDPAVPGHHPQPGAQLPRLQLRLHRPGDRGQGRGRGPGRPRRDRRLRGAVLPHRAGGRPDQLAVHRVADAAGGHRGHRGPDRPQPGPGGQGQLRPAAADRVHHPGRDPAHRYRLQRVHRAAVGVPGGPGRLPGGRRGRRDRLRARRRRRLGRAARLHRAHLQLAGHRADRPRGDRPHRREHRARQAVAAMTERNLDDSLGKAYMGDGAATALAGLGGGSGTTTYAENIGVMAATKVYSTAAYVIAGVTAILLGLVPKFGALIVTIPAGVLGGATTVLYGMIAVLGARIWIESRVDFRDNVNLVTAAVALIVGAANYTLTWGDLEFNGIALGSFGAIVIYQVLRALGGVPGTGGTLGEGAIASPAGGVAPAAPAGDPGAGGGPARAGGVEGTAGAEGGPPVADPPAGG